MELATLIQVTIGVDVGSYHPAATPEQLRARVNEEARRFVACALSHRSGSAHCIGDPTVINGATQKGRCPTCGCQKDVHPCDESGTIHACNDAFHYGSVPAGAQAPLGEALTAFFDKDYPLLVGMAGIPNSVKDRIPMIAQESFMAGRASVEVPKKGIPAWIPVGERLPPRDAKPGWAKTVLLFFPLADEDGEFNIGYHDPDDGWMTHDGGGFFELAVPAPTHWAPLAPPDSPKVGGP